jgi:hypothetical protein
MNLRIRAGQRAGAAFLAIAVTATVLPAQAGGATKPGLGALHDVAAVSARDAWAVGYSGRGNHTQVLIEHWNGSDWKAIPVRL